MAEQERSRGGSAHVAGPLSVEQVAERAERLEVTSKRVLEALASIAFGDIREIVGWDEGKLTLTPSAELLDVDAAAIAEIVAQAGSGKIYRIKLHDKPAALSLLARLLGMQTNPGLNEDEPTQNGGKAARDYIIREFDRIAAERAQGATRSEPQ